MHGQGTGDGGEHGANEFKYLEYFSPVYFHIDQELERFVEDPRVLAVIGELERSSSARFACKELRTRIERIERIEI